jgi:hypothetical protein
MRRYAFGVFSACWAYTSLGMHLGRNASQLGVALNCVDFCHPAESPPLPCQREMVMLIRVSSSQRQIAGLIFGILASSVLAHIVDQATPRIRLYCQVWTGR